MVTRSYPQNFWVHSLPTQKFNNLCWAPFVSERGQGCIHMSFPIRSLYVNTLPYIDVLETFIFLNEEDGGEWGEDNKNKTFKIHWILNKDPRPFFNFIAIILSKLS